MVFEKGHGRMGGKTPYPITKEQEELAIKIYAEYGNLKKVDDEIDMTRHDLIKCMKQNKKVRVSRGTSPFRISELIKKEKLWTFLSF